MVQVLRTSHRVITLTAGLGLSVVSRTTAAMAGGWWNNNGAIDNCVAAYQPKGADDLADSYIDLSGNGNDAAPGVAPSWNVTTGWTFNAASSQYLTTGVVPASGYSAIVRFANGATNANVALMGSWNGSDTRYYILSSFLDTTYKVRWGYGNGIPVVSPALASGVLALAGSTGYRNGSVDITSIGTWSGTGRALIIGALDSEGTRDRYYTGDIIAMAIYSDTLSSGEVSTLTTAMNAL